MYRLVVSRASPIGPQIEARPPSRTIPIAPLSALPPQISSKWLAFSLEPRAGRPCTRNVRSRTGMPMQRMRGGIFGAAAGKVMPESVMPVPPGAGTEAPGLTDAGSALCPLCTLVRAIMHPPSEQMVGNRERMRSREAVGMFPFQHQGCFRAVEPARGLEFRAVAQDILVGG